MNDKCEGCNNPATTSDDNGVPLCKACRDAIPTTEVESVCVIGPVYSFETALTAKDHETMHEIFNRIIATEGSLKSTQAALVTANSQLSAVSRFLLHLRDNTQVSPNIGAHAYQLWRELNTPEPAPSPTIVEALTRMEKAEAELAHAKAEIENLVWNLAGCDTLAMGYAKPGEFSNDLARPALHSVSKLRAERDALRSRMKGLRNLMGFIQDGSSSTVKLYQDDATGDFFVSTDNRSYWAESFEGAIDAAIKADELTREVTQEEEP